MKERMQVFTLFLCAASAYPYLVKKENIQWFQAIYYLSSFFGLFGSHTTSFLLAGMPSRLFGSRLYCQ